MSRAERRVRERGRDTLSTQHHGDDRTTDAALTLDAAPERIRIRPVTSYRHIDFRVKVAAHTTAKPDRTPVTLALVLDRSGSMSGEKLATAKRAASAVLDQLDERDTIAVVVFDSQIDVVQRAAPATHEIKTRAIAALNAVEARASTALHEGWLTGCQAIASDSPAAQGRGPARCFLLTDGIANVGETDPEKIASDAAGVRERTGIATSTFGIGDDYQEHLLAPMAVAGAGQFHHLRSAADIAFALPGELGAALAAVASQVRLELLVDPGVGVDVVSRYWPSEVEPGSRWSIAIGDLMGGEERHVVVRFGFPPAGGLAGKVVRARLVWRAAGVEHATDWRAVQFTYADHQTCDLEARDASVMHWVGLHHADRAQIEAARLNRLGQFEAARDLVHRVARRIGEYAGGDPDLQRAYQELLALEHVVASQPLAAPVAKEMTYQRQRASRAQADYRAPGSA